MESIKFKYIVILPFILVGIIAIFTFSNIDVEDTEGYELLTYNRADYRVSPEDIQKKAQEIETTTVGLDGTLEVNSQFSGNMNENCAKWWSLIKSESDKNSLDPVYVVSVIAQESNWDEHATSPTGCRGLMQLSKAALTDSGYKGTYTYDDMYKGEPNIKTGTSYLRWIDNFNKSTYGKSDKACIAVGFNAGIGYVDDYINKGPNGLPSGEKRNYPVSVMGRYEAYVTGALTLGERGNF